MVPLFFIMPAAKPLTKFQIETAMRYTKSNRAAAKYLGCSYQHYKPYAKLLKMDDSDPNSLTLFEAHKNQNGKGIPKFLPNKRKEPNVKNIILTGTGWESFTPEKIKVRLVAEGYLRDECYVCGFNERRVTDFKIPLLLHFKDNNKCNYLLDNLEQTCYNCYYLYVGEVLTPSQIRSVEDSSPPLAKPFEWDLDDEQIANMKALGIFE